MSSLFANICCVAVFLGMPSEPAQENSHKPAAQARNQVPIRTNGSQYYHCPRQRCKQQLVAELLQKFEGQYRRGEFHQALQSANQAKEFAPYDVTVETAYHLAQMQLQRANQVKQGNTPATEQENKETKREQIDRALKKPVSVNIKNMPLKHFIKNLGAISGLNIVADGASFREAGLSLEYPLSLKADNVSFGAALNLLLEDLGLRWIIRDETVVVKTRDRGRNPLVQRVYPVADLVVPIECHLDRQNNPNQRSLEEQLVKLITTTVDPDSWAVVGGPGQIQYFPLGYSLVVNQPKHIHEQITDLLAALRRMQDLQVVVQTRFVTMNRETFIRLHAKFNPTGKKNSIANEKTKSVLFLNDQQVQLLLADLKKQKNLDILSAPRVTLFNGQAAKVEVGREELVLADVFTVRKKDHVDVVYRQKRHKTGLQYRIHPVVSADRRFVRLGLNVKYTWKDPTTPLIPKQIRLQSTKKRAAGESSVSVARGGKPNGAASKRPSNAVRQLQRKTELNVLIPQPKFHTIKTETTIRVPNGQTALIFGGVTPVEAQAEFGPPILSDIPYLRRVFANRGYYRQERAFVILVRPHHFSRQNEILHDKGTKTKSKTTTLRTIGHTLLGKIAGGIATEVPIESKIKTPAPKPLYQQTEPAGRFLPGRFSATPDQDTLPAPDTTFVPNYRRLFPGQPMAPTVAPWPKTWSSKPVADSIPMTQVRFIGLPGIKVQWYERKKNGKLNWSSTPIMAPPRYNFLQGAEYRLKLSNIPGHCYGWGRTVYPTLQVLPGNPRTNAFLAHCAVPHWFSWEDVDRLAGGNEVVKVVFLPAIPGQGTTDYGVSQIISYKLPPNSDPICEAFRRGSPLLILRAGNVAANQNEQDLLPASDPIPRP